MRALVAIPVYNHPATLREVAEGARALHPDVLVVDDGSTVPVAPLLEGLDVACLRHEKNLGKGAAILTAAREAARRGMTHLITLDADGQHHPEDLPRFLEAVRAAPDAVIVGKRDFTAPNVPGSSAFGRSFSNFWLRVQTGRELGDVQSGYRAYPVALLEGFPWSEKRFSFEVEVLVRAAWAGVELRDLDIPVTYPVPSERVSHFHKVRDNLRLTALNTRLTMRSMLPWHTRRLARDAEGRSRVSVLHPLRSLELLLTENATPATLAVACGTGVFLGSMPLVGFQTLTILAVAGYFRLNRVATLGASQLCMPPLVPALCVETGYFLRHGAFLTEISLRTLGREALERFYEWFLGSLVLGPVLAAAAAAAVYAASRILLRKRVRRDPA